jgi:hypothetical protein
MTCKITTFADKFLLRMCNNICCMTTSNLHKDSSNYAFNASKIILSVTNYYDWIK